jgi:hypothetical protein
LLLPEKNASLHEKMLPDAENNVKNKTPYRGYFGSMNAAFRTKNENRRKERCFFRRIPPGNTPGTQGTLKFWNRSPRPPVPFLLVHEKVSPRHQIIEGNIAFGTASNDPDAD